MRNEGGANSHDDGSDNGNDGPEAATGKMGFRSRNINSAVAVLAAEVDVVRRR